MYMPGAQNNGEKRFRFSPFIHLEAKLPIATLNDLSLAFLNYKF